MPHRTAAEVERHLSNLFDLRTTAKRFRFVALFEALTWLGLLIGMAFKYLPAAGNDTGVQLFGPLHGGAFLLYLPVCAWTIRRLRRGFFVGTLAILAGFPPFGTFLFELWATGSGRMAELSAAKRRERRFAA